MMKRKQFLTRISFLAMLLPGLLLTASKTTDEPKKTIGTDISFHELLLPVPRTAQFIDDDYFNWGGSMIRTDDGVCHLFYSRWPRKYSFSQWVSHSEIAYAVADHPSGPWERFDVPLIDVSPDSTATDALLTANPAVAKRPDGKYIMAYKAAAIDFTKDNLAGPAVHRVATSDSPLGPFVKYPRLVFDAEGEFFPAEDPYIWYQDDRFLAILKDMHGAFTDVGTSLVLFESFDGIDWKLCQKPLVSKIEVYWEDGFTDEKVTKLERPQIYFEDGKPKVLFVAFRYTTEHSWNLQIPLRTDY